MMETRLKHLEGNSVTNKAPLGENHPRSPQPPETIEILWINGGLSCDGESIAITGATQPSIEDLVMGAIPGLPRVKLHNPFLSYENGDEFMQFFYRAERGELEPFILVVEGSIPDEDNKGEGYWAGFGTDHVTGQPVPTCEWIDRLAPKAWAVVAVGTCAAYGGIHAMHGNPTGAMGLPDYLGREWKSKAGIPIVCVPGCPTMPDNLTETLLYLLYQAAGRSPLIPLDEALRPTWLFSETVHEGCDRGGYYEQAQFAEEYGSRHCIVKENPMGRHAAVIGEVKTEPHGIVAMRTGFGGTRIVDMLVGEQLPRIC